MKHITFITLLFLIGFHTYAQPKREFRGAWIATVGNIDWPTRKGLSADQQQQQFINILNQHQQAGINAVVVQIRSVCDATYPSTLEPWAEVLSGKQGQAPQPYYDPLQFMITECRKRGMEFHAWMNPYRAVSNITTAQLDPGHVVRTHPDWLLAQGNLRILNPGLPDVRNYVTKVVMDVVRRYDVDGIHFDDYFYPYPQTGLSFSDDSTYAIHNRGIVKRDDWRRDNIDLLVKQVSDSIKAVKPYVKFGISPFGIWQNRSAAQPLGSATSGLQGYNEIYADSRKWIQQGWLDYIAPQVYWHIGFAAADYSVLVPWWDNVMKASPGRHLYIGQAAYRVNNDSNVNWLTPTQIPNQIQFNRQMANVQGNILYNTTSVISNPLGLRDSLRNRLFARPALQPAMTWKDAVAPPAPTLTVTSDRTTATLTWTRPRPGTGPMDVVRQFAVYRFPKDAPVDLSQAAYLLAVSPTDTTSYTDVTLQPGLQYTYVVTALDRLHNESAPSNPVSTMLILGEEAASTAGALVNAPNPFSEETMIAYTLLRAGNVRLTVQDLTGRELAEIVNERQAAGPHQVMYRAWNLPSGMYLLTLTVNNDRLSRRMIVQP